VRHSFDEDSCSLSIINGGSPCASCFCRKAEAVYLQEGRRPNEGYSPLCCRARAHEASSVAAIINTNRRGMAFHRCHTAAMAWN
jgi:hypothetical protein